MKKTIFLLFTGLLFVGCTTTKEEQYLSKFRKSFHYKTYRLASKKAIQRAVAEYNTTVPEPIENEKAHALLGITWFIAARNDYSFIEADLVKATSTPENKMLALGLQSIALSKMKCPTLAGAYYKELKESFSTQQKSAPRVAQAEHKMVLTSLIAVSLYQDDLDFAKAAADAFGTGSQLDYLSPLLGAVIETKAGDPHKAVAQLQELSKRDTFSAGTKKLFSDTADIIKNCPEEEQRGQALMDKLILQLVKGALDDLFSDENQLAFLKKITVFAAPLAKEWSALQPSAAEFPERPAPAQGLNPN
jgi:hypothetical protein